jgi:LemA protein
MPATAGGWIFLGVVAIVLIFAITRYNRLVTLRQHVRGAWADIDVQLKRRADLVDNLVGTVKGYAAHEQRTLTEVTKLRGEAASAVDPATRATAENALTRALRGLLAVAEAYPELKADQSFVSLQAELSQLEVDAQNARRYYNAVVRDYNTALETFPSNLVATLGAFRAQSFFEVHDELERRPPRVAFDR